MYADHSVEHLYSPSRWCKRFASPEECQESHIESISKESNLVRRNIPSDLDVPYGTLTKEKYDLIGTDLSDDSPILFFVHGGYWQEEKLERENSSYVAAVPYKHGIKSFIVGYELCPTVNLEEIVQQTEKALQICLKYAEKKRSRGVYLMGHSAGAHLIAHFFLNFTKTLSQDHRRLLKAAFLIGGIYDLEPLLLTSYNIPLKLTPSTARKLSPMFQGIDRCDSKFFVVVGSNDCPSFVSQSKMFDKKLKTEEINSELLVLENIDHFDIMEKIVDENFDLTQIILKTINKEN
ncbi:hypothetical protein WA026_011568 [Henosepilachna vigintioctopunctata]|uniref:Alpha/beta hydrolase fold-3 domain-containing protein n=1 Tax=Henosepilachna vigintioctopunctata TaxID=420089 RepID=A0AAW1TSF7_9CUCU